MKNYFDLPRKEKLNLLDEFIQKQNENLKKQILKFDKSTLQDIITKIITAYCENEYEENIVAEISNVVASYFNKLVFETFLKLQDIEY